MWIRTTIAIRNLAKEKTMAGAHTVELDPNIATSMTTVDHGITINIREKSRAKIQAQKEKVKAMTQKAKEGKTWKEKEEKEIILDGLRGMVTEGNAATGGTNPIVRPNHLHKEKGTSIAQVTSRAQPRVNQHLTNKFVATFATSPAI